jgi:hypothetical protein
MGQFTFGDEAVTIEPTTNIVLERLPITRGDREQFKLHRTITYAATDAADGSTFTYTVPDDTYVTDLASVPQLFTWLVPKSGRHLPAALVHDALVDDPQVDRFDADRIFRDAMGDLGVGFIRRWLMWTAVSLKTIQKRGTTSLRIGAAVTAALIVVLGALATINLFTDTTWVPWMGSRGVVPELLLGLAGAVVIPILVGALLWNPIRIAGMIAGVALAVLLHVMVLLVAVYGLYTVLERLPRRAQAAIGLVAVAASSAAVTYGVIAAIT